MPDAVSALVKEGVVAVLVAEGLAASSSPRRASVFGSGIGAAEETTREELRRWAIIIALGPITSSVYSGENKKKEEEGARTFVAVDHRQRREAGHKGTRWPQRYRNKPEAHDSQSNSPPHSAAQRWVQSEKKDIRYVISNALFLIVKQKYS